MTNTIGELAMEERLKRIQEHLEHCAYHMAHIEKHLKSAYAFIHAEPAPESFYHMRVETDSTEIMLLDLQIRTLKELADKLDAKELKKVAG